MLPGARGSSPRPPKMAGREISRIDAFNVAARMPTVVTPSATRRSWTADPVMGTLPSLLQSTPRRIVVSKANDFVARTEAGYVPDRAVLDHAATASSACTATPLNTTRVTIAGPRPPLQTVNPASTQPAGNRPG